MTLFTVSPVTFPVSSWQGLQPSGELADSPFFEFCDAIEVRDGVNAPAEGWGLDYALQAFGAYWSNTYYPDYRECALSESCSLRLLMRRIHFNDSVR